MSSMSDVTSIEFNSVNILYIADVSELNSSGISSFAHKHRRRVNNI